MILCFIVALCPKSWIRGLYGSCFKLFSSRLAWNAAKSACSRIGTRLAVLNSQSLKKTKIPSWIALHSDPKNSSRWLWIDGSRAIYPNWDSGEPNNYRGVPEDCVELRTNGKLNDLPCSRSLPYFCEINRKLQLI